MSMISCKECGSEVSSTAFHCPKCGAAPAAMNGNRTVWVAAIIGFVFVMVVLGSLGGCSSASTAPLVVSPAPPPPPPACTMLCGGRWVGALRQGPGEDTIVFDSQAANGPVTEYTGTLEGGSTLSGEVPVATPDSVWLSRPDAGWRGVFVTPDSIVGTATWQGNLGTTYASFSLTRVAP